MNNSWACLEQSYSAWLFIVKRHSSGDDQCISAAWMRVWSKMINTLSISKVIATERSQSWKPFREVTSRDADQLQPQATTRSHQQLLLAKHTSESAKDAPDPCADNYSSRGHAVIWKVTICLALRATPTITNTTMFCLRSWVPLLIFL